MSKNEVELEQRILRHVNGPNYRPVKPRVIAKKLGLAPDDLRLLKRIVKRLVQRGELSYAANHLVQSARKSSSSEVVGVFRRASGGYGFVRPVGTPASAGREQDIFVPAAQTRDAANGDLVRIRTSKRRSRLGGSRLTGEIKQVVERRTTQFVGTYYEEQGIALVRVDGTEFAKAVVVGDPGAKGVQVDDKVVVEMVRFPTAIRFGEGVIAEVLGKRGTPGVDTLTIMREFSLPERFPEEVLEGAREQAAKFDGSVDDHRRDLTELTVITIDPIDARDFDDAISLERLDNGHWLLGVHIADVSHFVPKGSPLDQEARDRATSVYLPDRVIPMLPEIVSNHLASLQPDQTRYVKTAFVEYTAEGVRVRTEFCSAAIRSKRRFAYEEVDQFLIDRTGWKSRLTPEVHQLLTWMHQLAMILRKRRLDRGSIELLMPEVKIELNGDGQVKGARRVEHTESHQIIEEFMLAANEAVAERLYDDEVPCLRRIHESPDPRKLESLTEFVRDIGISCDSLHNRFEIKRVLAEVAGKPLQQAVNYAVLRAMQKAVYSPEEYGHYALAADHYCHFTSPIRRYPDLTIHRLMDSIFRGRRPAGSVAALTGLGEHCSDREQRAEAAERELTKLKLLGFLAHRIGQQMDVIVTGVEDFGLFALGIDLPAEGLIPIDSLADDHYYHDPTVHVLMGHREHNTYRLGDLLTVRIASVDMDRRELDFELVERRTPGAKPRSTTWIGDGEKRSKRGRPGGRAANRAKKMPKAGPKARVKGGKGNRHGKRGRRA